MPVTPTIPSNHSASSQVELRAAAGPALILGPDTRLTCEAVERASRERMAAIRFSDRSDKAMRASQQALIAAAEAGVPIYGLTTGFGPHVRYEADHSGCRQGLGLIHHLGAGWGGDASAEIVRATMIIRCHAIAQGWSGVSPRTAEAFADLVRCGVTPCVPEIGSVGASGDLVPLSYCAAALTGEGSAVYRDTKMTAAEALRSAGLATASLDARDALAVVNGTAFMTGYLAHGVARSERLLLAAERLTGWLYRSLNARSQALDPRLHAVRGHAGQQRSAATIRAEAESFGPYEDQSRPLQEVYAVRCAPQILGACRENIDYARRLCEAEMSGVSDNPIIDASAPPRDAVIHGGNFQGQQIAFAADALNAALVQVAVLIDRQIAVLADPDLTGGPLLLAWQPGATSGIAGAQLTATSIVAEMRHHQGPAATSSIPTNGRNQDIVSMGTMAARQSHGQTDRLAAVLAVLSLSLDQYSMLRSEGKAVGTPTPRPEWAPAFEPFTDDRPLRQDIARIADAYLCGEPQHVPAGHRVL